MTGPRWPYCARPAPWALTLDLMQAVAAKPPKRLRLAPEVRRAQIVEAAAAIVLEQGYLPIQLDRLGQAAGASKALIYAYFPSQHELFNAVLARQFEALAAAGLVEASRKRPLEAAAQACAAIYFDQIAAKGPLIHVILRDHYMIGKLDQANRAFRDRLALRLARQARRELGLAAKENIAAFNLIVAIPELAGRMAWEGEMDPGRARALMEELISSSLAAFAPN
jgi:AcrR family transcriptional regulator